MKKEEKLVIGSDDAGFPLKEELSDFLKKEGIEFEDMGVYSKEDDTYYPLIAKKVVDVIIESKYEKKGILVCGTGLGMSITANKFPGIYAAVLYDIYGAERSRLSNNANVITFGSKITGPSSAIRLLKEWLDLEFSPSSRSAAKIKVIKQIESENFNYLLRNKDWVFS